MIQTNDLPSSAKAMEGKMEKIVSLCKRRGFVFPGSEIYGGLANSWDYGPLGVELKNNIKQLWWKKFIQQRDDVVGIDSALIMNTKVWEASGHIDTFNDPMIECKNCQNRFRVDKLIEDSLGESVQIAFAQYLKDWWEDYTKRVKKHILGLKLEKENLNLEISKNNQELAKVKIEALKNGIDLEEKIKGEDASRKTPSEFKYETTWAQTVSILSERQAIVRMAKEGVNAYIQHLLDARKISCPNCGKREFTEVKQFNMMFKTNMGPVTDEKSVVYLRPETAQGMFVNFKNVLDTSRKQLPFGIAQIGKAFRNEITPGNFIFRQREFEQMEIEYFIPVPKTDEDWNKYFEQWQSLMKEWMQEIGLDLNHVHELEVPKEELAHYSKRTIDFEYDFPFGKKELYGLAYRTDFDLQNHMKESKQSLEYTDPQTGEKSVPHVIEPTWGVDRSFLAVLCDSYREEDDRVYLKLPAKIAPYKVAVFPLLKNKPELVEKAKGIYHELQKHFTVAWDDRGNVGKRYYAQDEIGTPFCITVDFDTIEKDGCVTVRNRDTKEQPRVKIEELINYINKNL